MTIFELAESLDCIAEELWELIDGSQLDADDFFAQGDYRTYLNRQLSPTGVLVLTEAYQTLGGEDAAEGVDHD